MIDPVFSSFYVMVSGVSKDATGRRDRRIDGSVWMTGDGGLNKRSAKNI